jgi:hypothetical protein
MSRILYANLEFVPGERFSPEAMSLLEGLINRDPSLRLGAWENPPRDIMTSPFFASIEWDAVYEREQDGPWLPELAHYYLHYMRKTSPRKMCDGSVSLMADGSGHTEGRAKTSFSPAPMDRYTPISDLELAKAGHPLPSAEDATHERKSPKSRDKKKNKERGGVEEQEGDEEEEDSSEEESSEEADNDDDEELHIRDSVFFSKENAGNRLPDWSYIDAYVLMKFLTEAKKDKDGTSDPLDKHRKKNSKLNKVKKLLADAKEAIAKKEHELVADTIPGVAETLVEVEAQTGEAMTEQPRVKAAPVDEEQAVAEAAVVPAAAN